MSAEVEEQEAEIMEVSALRSMAVSAEEPPLLVVSPDDLTVGGSVLMPRGLASPLTLTAAGLSSAALNLSLIPRSTYLKSSAPPPPPPSSTKLVTLSTLGILTQDLS